MFVYFLPAARRSLGVLLTVALLVPAPALAQAQATPPPGTENAAATAGGYFDSRSACLTAYKYGSVLFDFGEIPFEQTHRAGDSLIVSGVLRNTNDYPLPEGRVYVHILRQDEAVEDAHWHPLVATFDAPGNFSLPGGGEKAFTVAWPIPKEAPEGLYRAEFYYLAGNRYVFSGLPYAPNGSVASVLFSVTSDKLSFPNFDRASVSLQGERLDLRAVPPTLTANDGAITVEANLMAIGDEAIPVTLTTELFSWSMTDFQAPLLSTARRVTLEGNSTLPLSLAWDAPVAGAFEAVFTATPDNPDLLPSLIKVRFPVAGNVPRIIFAGASGAEGDNAVVTTCTVNASKGEGNGSLTTAVLNGSQALGTVSGVTNALALSTTTMLVPLNQLAQGFSVSAEARDDQGNVTDSHVMTYTADMAAELSSLAASRSVNFWGNYISYTTLAQAAVIVIVVLIIVAWIISLKRIRKQFKRRPPAPPSPTPL